MDKIKWVNKFADLAKYNEELEEAILNFQQKTSRSSKVVEEVIITQEEIVSKRFTKDHDSLDSGDSKDPGGRVKAGKGVDEDMKEYGSDGSELVDINAVREVREAREIKEIPGYGSLDAYSSENRIVDVKGIMDAKLREIEKLKKSVAAKISEIDASREENLELRQKLDKSEPENLDLRQKLEKLESKSKKFESENTNLKDFLSEREANIKTENSKLDTLKQDFAENSQAQDQEIDRLNYEKDLQDFELNKLNSDLKGLRAENKNLASL